MDLLLSIMGIEPGPHSDARFFFDTRFAFFPLLLLALGGAVALMLPLWRLPGHRVFPKVVVGAIRFLILALLAFLLLEPSVVLLTPIAVREKLAVLVDASRSMSIQERQGDPRRWDKAIAAVSTGVLEPLKKNYDLELYRFENGLTPVAGVNALSAESPTGEETDLGGALEQLLREGRDLPVGALIVISDGIDRGPLRKRFQQDGEAGLRQELSALHLPIHTVSVASRDRLVDLSIEDLEYSEFAFLRQPFKVTATLRASQLSGTSTQVRLSSGGRLLSAQKVTLKDEGTPVVISFEINPTRVGKFTYTLEASVLPGEAVVENNSRSFTLKVVRDKTRVLQVAGAPSWDVKFLRRLLKSDPNVDLVSFFILRGPSDPSQFPPQDYSLIEFPYQDLFDLERDLKGFDVVIFQNFNYAPYLREQSRRLLSSLAEFVRQGGGLAMIGGELSFAAGDYGNTPLEEVLPVYCDRAPSVVPLPVQLSLTEQGSRHPVTVLHFDPTVNRTQWEALPRLDGYNPTSIQPGAQLLAAVKNQPDIPILAVREVEKGRTLALTVDTSYYLALETVGAGQTNLSYLRFWKNALRWLVGDPDEGQVQIDTERENYRLGEETVLEVRVAGADYGPVNGAALELNIRREAEGETAEQFRGMTGAGGELLWRFVAKKAGPYRASVKVLGGKISRGEAETVFTVSEEGPEMKELVGDETFLSALSSATGGEVLVEGAEAVSQKARSDRALSQRTVIPLWDRLPFYLLLLLFLGLEWLMRRHYAFR